MRKTLGYIGVAAMAISLASVPAARATTTRPAGIRATGTFVSAVPCVPTSAPQGNNVTCAGSSTWLGTLSGQTVYTVASNYNVVTGAGSGSIQETFTGRSSDGRTGTIHFQETVTSSATGLPDTGTLDIFAVADHGTGGFSGVWGSLQFIGIVNAAQSSGGYQGTLQIPAQ